MILAMAVLLFQFPTVTGASNLPERPPQQAAVTLNASASVKASGMNAVPSDNGSKPPQSLVAPAQPAAEPSVRAAIRVSYPPPLPAFRPPYEAPVTHRKWWLLLSATEHGSAAFDAWSTRYALCNGRVEADPIMRPFAGSSAIYGAIQAVPIGLDYLAHRMQRSSGWTRHVWWAPQSAAAATFLFSGSYNVAHTH